MSVVFASEMDGLNRQKKIKGISAETRNESKHVKPDWSLSLNAYLFESKEQIDNWSPLRAIFFIQNTHIKHTFCFCMQSMGGFSDSWILLSIP